MKKFKLLVSITLLCLTIANLCVGVLAIQNIAYTIGGTINYKIEDIYAQITTKIYKRQEQRTSQELQTDATQLSSMVLSDITYTLSQDKGTYNSFTNSGTSSAKDIDITFGAGADGKIYYTYYIVVNIENLSTVDNMYAVLEDNNTDESNVYKYCVQSQDKILKGSKNRNIVIAYSVGNTLRDISLPFEYNVSIKMGTLPTKTITYDANGGFLPSLCYDTDDVGSSTSYAGQSGAGYYIQNGEIYVDSLKEDSKDCYVHTKIKIDMTAGKKYIMKFDGQRLNDVSTTIGVGLFLNNAYNYYIFKDPVQTPKKNTPEETTVTFEPTTTGTYQLRIDSNMSDAKIKISNLRIYEDGTGDIKQNIIPVGNTYGGISPNIYPYTSHADANGWYNISNLSNAGTSTSYYNEFSTYNPNIVAGKSYISIVEIKNVVKSGNVTMCLESPGSATSTYGSGQFTSVYMGTIANGTYYYSLNSIDVSSLSSKYFLRTFLSLPAGSSVTSVSIRISVYEESLPVPTKAGYVFAGWWTEKSGGTLVTSYSKVAESGNQTLYAHWKTV